MSRIKGLNGLEVFLDKANQDIRTATSNYEFYRSFSKNPEKELQRANEAVYKAIQDRNLFIDLINKIDDENEEMLFGD